MKQRNARTKPDTRNIYDRNFVRWFIVLLIILVSIAVSQITRADFQQVITSYKKVAVDSLVLPYNSDTLRGFGATLVHPGGILNTILGSSIDGGEITDSTINPKDMSPAAKWRLPFLFATDTTKANNSYATKGYADTVANSKFSDSSITLLNATAWRMFYSNATTTAIQELAFGASGFLKTNGASAAPTWSAIADADVPNDITINTATTATNVADADKGDLTISSGVWSVEDDSHSHTNLHTRLHTMTSTADHSATANRVFYADASGHVVELALGGSGTYLQGTTPPTFATPAATAVWLKKVGATCDTVWWNLGNDTVYMSICPDSINFWGTKELTIGKGGALNADSITTRLIISDSGVFMTQLRLPSATAPTLSYEGDIAWDANDNKLITFDSTANPVTIASKIKSRSFVLKNIEVADDLPFWQTPRAITLTKVSAKCKDGTNVVGQLEEYDSYGLNPASTMTGDLTVTTTEVESSTFSNASIVAGSWLGWKTTSVSGTVTIFSVTFEYYEQ